MIAQQILPQHLQRLAYLYIRQSTVQQVVTNIESTARQYALQERAVALGWPTERIVVIDQDVGHSGASAADAPGSSAWSPRWASDAWGWCSAWKSRAWRAVRAIGIASWRSVP